MKSVQGVIDRCARVLRRTSPLYIVLLLVAVPMFAQERRPKFEPEEEMERMEQLRRQSAEEADEETREDVRGREEWFYHQRAFPYDLVPAGARAEAIRQTQTMEANLRLAKKGPATLADNRWEEIGPYNVGGRIRAIAVDPTNSDIIYIGAAAGGVWKTTDAGVTWSTTFDAQSSLAMGAIAIDPQNTQTIYAGTGEDTPHPVAYMGDGMFKSTDGGASWSHVGLSQVGAFSKIYVNPRSTSIVYATTTRASGGFYRSTDFGATWTQTFSIDAYDMTVNPVNPDEIFISTTNAIYRSTDGGANFTRASDGFDGTNGNRVSVALAPSQPTKLYALISRTGGSQGNNLAAIYLSTNSGTTWTLSRNLTENFFRTQGNYNNAIAVHPTDPNVVFALGIDIYRTTNGGQNWVNMTNVYNGSFDMEVAHPDQHVVTFDPQAPDIVYVGSDGGLYRSLDIGLSWRRVSANLPISQFYKMDIDQSRPYRAYGGTQDNGSAGTFSGTSEFSKEWNSLSGGDGFWVAVDPQRSDVIYTEIYYGQTIYRINLATGQFGIVNVNALNSDQGDWSTPLAISFADPKWLYSGRRNLWRTSNNGGTWAKLTLPASNYTMSTLALSPNDASLMIVGKGGGGVYYSVDDGTTWNSSSGLPLKYVTCLQYDPEVDSRVYATYSGFGGRHIFRSDDSGASFVDITANLPDVPVNAIAIDPYDNTHLFVGTDAGVFVSLDGGNLWLPFNEGLAMSPVTDLKIHVSSHTLQAATFGRSMFSINIDSPQPQPLIVTPVGGETIQTPDTLMVQWAGFNGPVRVLISYDGGSTYDTLVATADGSSIHVPLPLVKSSNARIKIEEIDSDRLVVSGSFVLTPASNSQSLSSRGFVAQALATRQNEVWATQRNSDTMYRMKLPIFLSKREVVRSGFSGTIRDLAYDSQADLFYALVTNDDYSGARLWKMDTTGAAIGEIPLPVTSASGIEMAPEGIAVVTPGAQGDLYILDPANGDVVSHNGTMTNGSGNVRNGLAWDGQGLVQAVDEADPGSDYPSQLQRLQIGAPPKIVTADPVIVTSASSIPFFGLTYDSQNSDGAKRIFYATDTSGALFKITLPFVSDVPGETIHGNSGVSSMEIADISPNPFRDQAHLSYRVAVGGPVTVELWGADGTRAEVLFDGVVEAGEHRIDFRSQGLSSGIYYVALTNGRGERVVRPVVVMK